MPSPNRPRFTPNRKMKNSSALQPRSGGKIFRRELWEPMVGNRGHESHVHFALVALGGGDQVRENARLKKIDIFVNLQNSIARKNKMFWPQGEREN